MKCLILLARAVICRRIKANLAVCDDGATFEAEPVDGTNHEKNNQRELEDGDTSNCRDIVQAGKCGSNCGIGVHVTQSAEPEKVDNHQTAINQRDDIDNDPPATQAEGSFIPGPAFETSIE